MSSLQPGISLKMDSIANVYLENLSNVLTELSCGTRFMNTTSIKLENLYLFTPTTEMYSEPGQTTDSTIL